MSTIAELFVVHCIGGYASCMLLTVSRSEQVGFLVIFSRCKRPEREAGLSPSSSV
jgi:hypothetical protein